MHKINYETLVGQHHSPPTLEYREPGSMKRARKRGFLFSVLILITSISLVGCYSVKSRSDAIGLYELNAAHDKIGLAVSTDGTFVETITWSSGKVDKREGKWNWTTGRIGFDGLWIPESFAPDYIKQADSQPDSHQPKYTAAGYWSMSVEKHWGTTTLAVFPDADISFNMVQR